MSARVVCDPLVAAADGQGRSSMRLLSQDESLPETERDPRGRPPFVPGAVIGRRLVPGALGVLLIAVAGCVAQPSPSIPPSAAATSSAASAIAPATAAPPVVIHPAEAPVVLAQTTEALSPRWGPSPDGPILLDDFGENRTVLDAGTHVVLLGAAQPGPDGTWVPVWIVPNQHSWPNDFAAWLPATQNGRATLRQLPSETCPALATIATLGPLLAPDRRRCVGGEAITFEAKTWRAGFSVGYVTDPAWLSNDGEQARTVSLFDGGPDPFALDAPVGPQEELGFIDARVPDAVDLPPLGMIVRVTGHFDDPIARSCQRRFERDLGPGQAVQPGWGLPPESADASAEWCRNQFVVTAWDVALGPEGRPIDLADPQLHRAPWLDVPGQGFACGGVGMPALRVRIDPTRIDPVWLDVAGGGTSVARFSKGFRLVLGPPPMVVATTGVTLVDGEFLDPDHGKPGIAVCPEGEAVDLQAFGPVPPS